MLAKAWTTFLSLSLIASGAGAVGLDGANVSAAIYCCSAPPSEATRVSNLATATVGPAVEFPIGALHPTGGLDLIPVVIDIAAATIDIDYEATLLAGSGGFNGYIFQFSSAPEILGVSLGAVSTFTPSGLSFTENSVLVNVAGQSVTASSRLRLDVSTVPEPGSALLTAVGLITLSVSRRSRYERRR